MISLRTLPVLLVIVFITACNTQKTVEKFVDKERDLYAREFIQQFIDGDTTVIYKIDESQINSGTRENINYLFSLLYHKEVKSIKIVGLTKNVVGGNNKYTINYEYELENNYAFISITTEEVKNLRRVIGFRVDINKQSALEYAKFTFAGKSIIHYLILLLVIAIPLFIIYSMIVMLRSGIRRKWLWVILLIILNISFTYNWHTETFFWNKLNFQLLGLGIKQGNIYAPWDFAVSIPLGAIIFWFRLRKLKHEEREYQELIDMYADNNSENEDQEEKE